MKLIDKFLKKLNVSRNTFATYVLTLLTVYLAVDRIVEMLLMIFTGVSYSYWGPIQYTLALACPIFAFLFSGSSTFVKADQMKLGFFYLYCISLYIIGILIGLYLQISIVLLSIILAIICIIIYLIISDIKTMNLLS